MDAHSNESIHNNGENTTPPVPERRTKAARMELDRALSFHLRGEKASALKSFRKALNLDPGLAIERLTRNIAQELTGLPAQEALKNLIGEHTGKELIQTAKREQKKPPTSFRQRLMVIAFIIALVALVGIIYKALQVRTLDSYLTTIRMMVWQTQKHTLGGYEYYALVPRGSPPPEGWPVVVAFHGMDGQASHMLPFAQTFLEEGVLFIAPSFGGYAPWPKGPIEVMSRILKEVGENHPLDTHGAILLGHSQGGTFAYRFSVYYPDQVAGVVTAGAPEFDAVNPARRNMPYVFTWGEYDWLQEFMLPPSFALRNNGFNVRIYIVPDAEHEMTQFAVEKALAMLVQR